MMTRAEQLKTIQEMPLVAAYWMGRRDAHIQDLEKFMANHTSEDFSRCENDLAILTWHIDQCNENFGAEMGWPDSDQFFK